MNKKIFVCVCERGVGGVLANTTNEIANVMLTTGIPLCQLTILSVRQLLTLRNDKTDPSGRKNDHLSTLLFCIYEILDTLQWIDL